MLDIKPYEQNAKKHPDKQLKQIAKSIKEFGWQQPIVVDKKNIIIVGHGRWFSYQKFKDEMSLPEPEIKVADLTEKQSKAYRLADNKLNDSPWDMKLVIEELKLLDNDMIDLTGFSKDLILDDDEKDDKVPESAKETNAKLGEVYQLGKHRVMCGDSTKIEEVEKLLDGNRADILFTDPPYNVGYKYNQYDDNKTLEEYQSFCTDWFNLAKTFTDFQIITPGTVNLHMWASIEKWKSIAPWIKKNAMNNGEISHLRLWEPILFYGKSKKRRPADLFEHNLKGEKIEHTCPKPVDLVTDCLVSFDADTVLDLFLGSGTTLIACEKSDRICFGMELDPKYVDVIIERWEDYTGNKAEKL